MLAWRLQMGHVRAAIPVPATSGNRCSRGSGEGGSLLSPGGRPGPVLLQVECRPSACLRAGGRCFPPARRPALWARPCGSGAFGVTPPTSIRTMLELLPWRPRCGV